VRKLLFQTMKFRKMARPMRCKPLCLPPLSHKAFLTNVKYLLELHIDRNQATLIPFHFPKSTVTEGKHTSLIWALHNWSKFMKEHTMGTEEPCCCQKFLTLFPTAPTIDGHVVVDGLYTGLSHSAKTIFQSNGSNAFFPGKEQFLATATTCLEEWLTDHGLAWDILPEFQELVQAEWETHLQQVHPDALRWGDVVAFRKTYADFIFHCEDHEPKKLVAYCRQFYAETLNRTFSDPAVFRQLQASPVETLQHCLNDFSPVFLTKYKWGVNRAGRLPSAYVFPKGKKTVPKRTPHYQFCGNHMRKTVEGSGCSAGQPHQNCLPQRLSQGLATSHVQTSAHLFV
jgi:hypothetical protein